MHTQGRSRPIVIPSPACARFDPATKSWEELPPLPEPRSSHDVVVIDNQVIVVGGWALDGKSKSRVG
jgi:streptogramin lyase